MGNKKAKWQKFGPPADLNGFNLPGLELFNRGGQVPSVVRETGQNSVDNPNKTGDPVIISYEKKEICPSHIPGREELVEILKSCLQFGYDSGQKEIDEPMKFMREAFDQLQDNKPIPILEISDENTVGIEGEDGNYKLPWERMTGAIGISDGSDSTRGGSRGIGKFAPLLLSSLRTLFISTKTKDGVAFKGGAQFTSFQEDDFYEAKIKYEKGERKAIRNEEEIPEFFRRDKIGTSIFVVGFKLTNGWENQIINAVLTNFYAAIHSGRLVVKTNHHNVTSQNLQKYITSHADEQTKMFYHTLKEGIEFSETLKGFGNVKLFVKIDELFTKRIDYMRDKRMKIFDQRRGPLLTKNYAAVFICDGKEGSQKLRLMEGAEHVSWKPRNKDEEREYKRLKIWIENKIKSLEPEDDEDETSVTGTENLLPIIDDGTGDGAGIPNKTEQKEETARESILLKDEEIKIGQEVKERILYITPDGSLKIPQQSKKPSPKPPRPNPPSPTPPNPNPPKPKPPKPKRKINLESFQVVIVKDERKDKEYHLYIESSEEKELEMNVLLNVATEHGETISNFNILKSAEYSNGVRILKEPEKDMLKNVILKPGLNKVILNMTTNSKYAFKISGNESE